jgi:uncharacterized protein YhaN
MIITELNLIGFGKFKNRIINLNNGLNIIYGQNEGGKSTLHSFIDGMFYGFLRPYVKSTLYKDEHKKYEPWDSDRYAGIIKFVFNGEEYRIERVFTKNKEETSVYLEKTGEDITYKINNGPNGRVLQPGMHFFGVSNSVFSNTVSIKQLGTKTDDKLANEVRDKLVNITSSLDDKVSVENAIKELDKRIRDIGTEKASTTPYGRLYRKLRELYSERDNINKYKDEYEKLLDENNELGHRIEVLDALLNKEKELLNLAIIKEKKSLFNEASDIINKLREIEEEIKVYEKYKTISKEDYAQAFRLSNDIQIISGRIDDLKSQAFDLKVAIDEENLTIENKGESKFKEISTDYINYDELEDAKNKLIYAKNHTNKEFIKRDYASFKSKVSKIRILIVGVIVSYIVLTLLSLIKDYFNFTVLSQLLLLPICILLFSNNRLNKCLKEKELQFKKAEKEELDKEKEIENIERKLKEILDKYNLKSKIELKNLYNNIQHSQYIRDEKLKAIVEKRNRLNYINTKVEELISQQKELLEEFNIILRKNEVNSLKEFDLNLKKKNIYEEKTLEYHSKKEILNKILNGSSIDELKAELAEYTEIDNVDIEGKDDINNRINNISERLTDYRIEKRGLEERLNILTANISSLVDIEEEIDRVTAQIRNLDFKKKSLELAKTKIEELSKDIQNQFAPEINKKVGNLISRITNGKYSGVRINDNLEIGVIKHDTGELLRVDSLSVGTIDQLYFSLRLGIINSINNESLPLILDDCFTQYDENRLKNILALLEEISKNRQIILFSCHNREKDLLTKLGSDFNLIILS